MPGKKKLGKFWNEKARTQVLSAIVVALMITVAMTGIFITLPKQASAASYTQFTYHKKITISSSLADTPLADFPVYLYNVSSDFNSSSLRSDFKDIYFTLPDNTTALSYELDDDVMNLTTGTIGIYIKIPLISSSSDTTIWMHYGDSDISETLEDPEGTWNSHYEAVWHMNGTVPASGGGLWDSTSNHWRLQNLTTLNSSIGIPAEGDGKIGKAQVFTADCIQNDTFWDSSVPASWTVEAWVKPSNAIGSADLPERIMYKKCIETGDRFYLNREGSNGTFDFMPKDGSTYYHAWGSVLSTGNWHYICGVYAANDHSYAVVNTTRYTGAANGNGLAAGTFSNLSIGGYSDEDNGLTRTFNGTIDEIRISNVALNASWTNATYRTLNNPETYLTFSVVGSGTSYPSAPTGASATAYTNFDISLSGLDANSRITFPTAHTNDTSGDIVWANETSYGVLTVSNDGVQQINLSWTKGSGATKTVIRRDTTSHATWTLSTGSLLANITDNYYHIGSLSPGTHYYFALWSWNSSGYSETYATCDAIVGNASVTNLTIHIEDVGSGTALIPKENFTLYGNASGAFASLGAFDATTGNITLTTTYAGLPLAIGDKLYFEFKAVVGAGAQPDGTYYDNNAQTLDCYVKAER